MSRRYNCCRWGKEGKRFDMRHFHNCTLHRHQGTHATLLLCSHSLIFLMYTRLIWPRFSRWYNDAMEFQGGAQGSGIYRDCINVKDSFHSSFPHTVWPEKAADMLVKVVCNDPTSGVKVSGYATKKLCNSGCCSLGWRVVILGAHQHLDSLRQWEIAATRFKLGQEFVIQSGIGDSEIEFVLSDVKRKVVK